MRRRRGRGNTSWARGGSWRGLLGALATIVPLVGTIRAQQPLTGTGSRLSKKLGRQIEVLLPEFPSAAWIGARNGMGAETVNLPQGSAARQAAAMRRSHGVDGTGVGIGVLSTTEDPKGSMSDLSSATCLIAANPDLETFCGSWDSPGQMAALAALIIEEAGRFEAPARCCLITTADSRRNPGVRAFREWILKEA